MGDRGEWRVTCLYSGEILRPLLWWYITSYIPRVDFNKNFPSVVKLRIQIWPPSQPNQPYIHSECTLDWLWQAKCSNIQFMLFLFNSIFHVQLFVQYSTFIQCSMLRFLSTRRLTFNYLFNVQLFIQHSTIYSMFNLFSNIQFLIKYSTF